MASVIDYGRVHRVVVPYFIDELRAMVEQLPETVQRNLALGPLDHTQCRLCQTFSMEWGWGDGHVGIGERWPESAVSLHAYHNAAEIEKDKTGPAIWAVMQARSFLIYEVAATAIYGERV